jgi:hypothetical protein
MFFPQIPADMMFARMPSAGSLLALRCARRFCIFSLVAAIQGSVADLLVLKPKLHNYETSDARFGFIPYGSDVAGEIYYAHYGCLPMDAPPGWSKDGSRSILLVDRGSCSYNKKVLMGQRAGAKAVVVADNTDIASLEIMTGDNPELEQAVSIPSVFLRKEAGDALKAQLAHGAIISASLDWKAETPHETADWEFWLPVFMTKSDELQTMESKALSAQPDYSVLQTFAEIAAAVEPTIQFRPHIFIVGGDHWYQDGKMMHCSTNYDGAQPKCGKFCSNSGRYCIPDPAGYLDNGMVGGAVLQEALRQLCVYKVTAVNTGTGKSKKFFEYVLQYSQDCSGDMTRQCSERVQKRLQISKKRMRKCVKNSGGAGYGAGKNKMFEKELKIAKRYHVLRPSTILVDHQEEYTGRIDCPEPIQLKTCSLLMKLCSRVQEDQQPPGCEEEYWRKRAASAAQPDLSTASPPRVASQSTATSSPGVAIAIHKIEENQQGMQQEMVRTALCCVIFASLFTVSSLHRCTGWQLW